MDIFEAIRTRRSIGKVTQDEVPQEWIERILEAGTWAPNHRRTEPWRFFVLRGEGRKKLGQALAEIALKGAGDAAESGAGEEERAKLAAKAYEKALRAPLIIAAAVEPSEQKGVIELEEYAAVFAAIQNMLLEIHGLGLGAVWRTGEQAYDPVMNRRFGLTEKGKVLGFLYIGKPDLSKQLEGRREAFSAKTVWIDEA